MTCLVQRQHSKPDELGRFLEESIILTDQPLLELIKKLGSSHSTMAVTYLPIPKLPKDNALARLYQLEKLGVLTSKLEKRDEDHIRVFRGTSLATRIADIMSTG